MSVEFNAGRDPLTEKVIGAAIEVHRNLGPGLLESVYEQCLCFELAAAGLAHQRQMVLPIKYKAIEIEAGLKLDIVVENQLVIELKSVDRFNPVHEAQLLTYLKLTGIKRGLLLNFNVQMLKDGVKRMVV